jgi:hypothetical protein
MDIRRSRTAPLQVTRRVLRDDCLCVCRKVGSFWLQSLAPDSPVVESTGRQ